MRTTFSTLVEGVGVIAWACNLSLLVPGLALVLVARRARLSVALWYVAGAALLGWARAAGYWGLASTGAMAFVIAALAAGTYAAAWFAPGHGSPLASGAGLVGGALAGWLWRPCVGERLGDIVNDAAVAGARTLSLMAVYLVGALLPVLLLAVVPMAAAPVERVMAKGWLAQFGLVVGITYAIAVALGLAHELIGELYRIQSGY